MFIFLNYICIDADKENQISAVINFLNNNEEVNVLDTKKDEEKVDSEISKQEKKKRKKDKFLSKKEKKRKAMSEEEIAERNKRTIFVGNIPIKDVSISKLLKILNIEKSIVETIERKKKKKKKVKNIPHDEKTIFVKIRNSEQIKKAKIKFSLSNNTAYLKVKQKDTGFSPGQIITLYFPFIIKKNNKVTYITNLNKYNNLINTNKNTIYYHCLGSATISNQFLDYNLYQHIKNIHQINDLNMSK
ncbi:hypothetical protein PFNF54_05454 [Plasmodium falciparum NF54]|uniref:tRNA-specific 2-thiouridylase MnmA-like C-terminal domain-containing protein n=1 Tax=Plasmodium falciparum (isolate NF54) TaxID=5843 RepID=W7K7P3_PLAFO|nr:hypothetical protein PFNF54_05454 [Plasmodium falciparum NF54]